MEDLFQHLEINIKAFLQQYSFLRDQNHNLLKVQDVLSHEKIKMKEKQTQTIATIKNMIQRIQSIEKNL
jgi:hypothetical protein